MALACNLHTSVAHPSFMYRRTTNNASTHSKAQMLFPVNYILCLSVLTTDATFFLTWRLKLSSTLVKGHRRTCANITARSTSSANLRHLSACMLPPTASAGQCPPFSLRKIALSLSPPRASILVSKSLVRLHRKQRNLSHRRHLALPPRRTSFPPMKTKI